MPTNPLTDKQMTWNKKPLQPKGKDRIFIEVERGDVALINETAELQLKSECDSVAYFMQLFKNGEVGYLAVEMVVFHEARRNQWQRILQVIEESKLAA